VSADPPVRTTRGDLPRVAIVILNYNGRHHLQPCFESLLALDYPRERWRVVLVDNGSVDGSLEEVRRSFAWVTLLDNDENVGFSAGCNQGAAEAGEAEVLVFLNNDMRVDRGFLRALVAPLAAGDSDCVTGKLLSWDGKRVNSAGGGMNFHGIGIQLGYEEAPAPEHDRAGPTLFACGGAMAIDAGVFAECGGFDEDFFAYYEDVDLGWRLWVMGFTVSYAPDAVCYHHHSSTSRAFPLESVRLLQVRNPLLACVKNYDDANLARILPAALGLAVRRAGLLVGVEDERPFRIENAQARRTNALGKWRERARRRVAQRVSVRREAVADLLGVNDLLGDWGHWMQRRAEVQSRRRRPDTEIFGLFQRPLWCIERDASYAELHRGLTEFLGIDELFDGRDDHGPDPRT